MLDIRFIKLTDTAILPTPAYTGDVGFDLYSDEDVVLEAGSVCKVKTGLELAHVDSPERCWDLAMSPPCFLKIEGRSSLASKGIFPIGGVIDPSYRGEITVVLAAIAQPNWKNENGEATNFYNIKKSDRIAQLVAYRAYVNDDSEEYEAIMQSVNLLIELGYRKSF